MDAVSAGFKWGDFKADELRKFLVDEKQFGEDRVNKAIERLQEVQDVQGASSTSSRCRPR